MKTLELDYSRFPSSVSSARESFPLALYPPSSSRRGVEEEVTGNAAVSNCNRDRLLSSRDPRAARSSLGVSQERRSGFPASLSARLYLASVLVDTDELVSARERVIRALSLCWTLSPLAPCQRARRLSSSRCGRALSPVCHASLTFSSPAQRATKPKRERERERERTTRVDDCRRSGQHRPLRCSGADPRGDKRTSAHIRRHTYA